MTKIIIAFWIVQKAIHAEMPPYIVQQQIMHALYHVLAQGAAIIPIFIGLMVVPIH